MKVRNKSGRSVLLSAQGKVVAPGIDLISVRDDEEVRFLIEAGALEGEGDSYAAQSVEELQAEADSRGLEVEGSGADGRVLKADLVTALEAHDEAGNPPPSDQAAEGGDNDPETKE